MMWWTAPAPGNGLPIQNVRYSVAFGAKADLRRHESTRLTRFRHSSPRNDVGAFGAPTAKFAQRASVFSDNQTAAEEGGIMHQRDCLVLLRNIFPASPGANISPIGAISHKLTFDFFAYAFFQGI